MGRFILRDGALLTAPPEPKEYWTKMAVTSPRVAKVALRLLSIAPTEASVERAFSHRASIHSALRNSLSDASVDLRFCSTFTRSKAMTLVRSSKRFEKRPRMSFRYLKRTTISNDFASLVQHRESRTCKIFGAKFDTQALMFVRMNSIPLGLSSA